MSIINQSNQNSSLVNTLMDAQASVSNPFEYAIEKQVAFHGMQIIKHDAINKGSFGVSSSIDFDLTKFGFIRSMIFTWDTKPASGTTHVPPSGTLNCIERVELLSASRRLAVMDRHALRCAISDMPQDVKGNYYKGLNMLASGTQMGTNVDHPSYLFLPMSFFCNVKNSLAASFVEPLKLRIVTTDCAFGTSGSATTVCTPSNPALYVEYRVLDPESEDKTIENNYDNVLTQLTYDYHTETEVTGNLLDTAELDLECEIKDPGVVSSAYVIVSCDYKDIQVNAVSGNADHGAAKMLGAEQPLICTKVGFKASGQEIIPDVPARILELYGRRDLSQDFHHCGFGTTYNSREDPGNFHNIYKIDFGLDSDNRYNSGGVSLRELNTPTIKITVRRAAGGTTAGPHGGGSDESSETTGVENTYDLIGSDVNAAAVDNRKVTMRVILKKHTLISTDPASGRMVQAISN
jgi:hypothetical protein